MPGANRNATLKELERFAFIALDLAETTRTVRGRALLTSEAKPFAWVLRAFDEPPIATEMGTLPLARQQQLFRLVKDLTSVIHDVCVPARRNRDSGEGVPADHARDGVLEPAQVNCLDDAGP